MRTESAAALKPKLALRSHSRIAKGIARGERAVKEGRTVTHAAAKKRMARWLNSK